MSVDVVHVDGQELRAGADVARAREPVATPLAQHEAGAPERLHLGVSDAAVGVQEARLAALAEAEDPLEPRECGVEVPIG